MFFMFSKSMFTRTNVCIDPNNCMFTPAGYFWINDDLQVTYFWTKSQSK